MNPVVVSDQITVPNESSPAHIALVVLSRRVRPYVHGELRFTRECHRATITAERLLRDMRPSASIDWGILIELYKRN